MKKIRIQWLLAVTAVLSLLASCIREELPETGGSGQQKGVKVLFSLTTPNHRVAESRALYENNIEDVYLLVFDEEERFLEYSEAVSASGTDNFFAYLTPRTTPATIYVVANVPVIMGLYKDTWEEGVTTLHQVKNDLMTLPLFDNDKPYVITEMPVLPPLVSMMPQSLPSIDKTMTLNNILLQRATAKITVEGHVMGDLFIHGANLCRVPAQGYVFDGMNPSGLPFSNYSGAAHDSSYSDYPICIGSYYDPLYCYESTPDYGTYLIVKAEYKGVMGYYRINMVDLGGNQLHLKRNYHYAVYIQKVQHPGYRTAAEAMNNPPLNTDLNYVGISIFDDYSHDIVSNGEYYLGVENSEFIIYTNKGVSNELVTTVMTDASYNINRGEATIKAWDAAGNLITNGVSVNNPFREVNPGAVISNELRATLPVGVVSAEIQLRIGTLEKTIRIQCIPDNLSFGGPIALDPDYVTGSIPPGLPWIKFSDSEDTEVHHGVDHIVKPAGASNIYMILAPNIVLDSSQHDMQATLFLFRANEKGRTKVKVFQPPFDIFKKETTLMENLYVGTFHRHDQTGERVIRMGEANGSTWMAEVVAGRDFIKLVPGGSPDPNIYTGNPGDAENYQVYYDTKARTMIVGQGEIFFRVGLKDRIAPTEHRYGVILVTHSRGTSRIFVRQGEAPDYLYREEDPVLNDWTIVRSKPRPETVRLSPYNLSDPRLGTGITDGTSELYCDHNSMPLDYHPESPTFGTFNKNKFTEYPTQAGYLFIWNTLAQPQSLRDDFQWVRAVHPIRTGTVTQLISTTQGTPNVTFSGTHTYAGDYGGNGDGKTPKFGYANALQPGTSYNFSQIGRWYEPKTDPCPYGYRYPHAGKVNETATGGTTLFMGQDAYYSELLQAMFYDPHINNDAGAMSQYMLSGYYADGFFDRLPITTPPGETPAANSMVVRGGALSSTTTGNDIGYAGTLVFNPFNYASIFHPAPGYWLYGMRFIGSDYNYWTTDRVSTTASSQSVLYLMAGRNQFIVINSSGSENFPKSVRCVRDKNIPLPGYPEYD